MIKFNPFKTLISKFSIENDDYKNWHRKFAILPVYDMVENRKRLFCNVFRRREEYRRPTPDSKPKTKYYWVHIPYNDLELIKQTDRETSGDYKPVKYPPTFYSFAEMVLLPLVVLVTVGIVFMAIATSMNRAEQRAQLEIQADKAQSLDELKLVVKKLVEFTK